MIDDRPGCCHTSETVSEEIIDLTVLYVKMRKVDWRDGSEEKTLVMQSFFRIIIILWGFCIANLLFYRSIRRSAKIMSKKISHSNLTDIGLSKSIQFNITKHKQK